MSLFKQLIQDAPNNPGVYNFIDLQDKIIYVGKAKNLKKRLSSYLKSVNYKTQVAVLKTVKVQWTICKTEAEALLLENEQVKQFKPRYNVLLKDDKTFPEIFIGSDNKFPAIRYHRGAHELKGKYFGPFPNPKYVKSVIDTLKKATMIRGCADGDFATRKRPCLEYQIGRCTAPCVGFVDKKDYNEQIKDAIMILNGKSTIVKKKFNKEMQVCIDKKDFEQANFIKNKLKALEYVSGMIYS